MKQKGLTKTFMMISNWKRPFNLHGLCKNCQRSKGYVGENVKEKPGDQRKKHQQYGALDKLMTHWTLVENNISHHEEKELEQRM